MGFFPITLIRIRTVEVGAVWNTVPGTFGALQTDSYKDGQSVFVALPGRVHKIADYKVIQRIFIENACK